MEKCWFPLRQTHYPPPVTKAGSQGTTQSGAICLGDLISDLKHLDQRINETGQVLLPATMPIFNTTLSGFTWRNEDSPGLGFSGAISAPITTAVGITAGAELEISLKKSAATFDEVEFLEVAIIQPRRDFIDKYLASEEPSRWIQKNKSLLGSWKIFMITGIIIARGKKTRRSEAITHREVSGGPDVDLAGVAGLKFIPSVKAEQSNCSESEDLTDFVWALRLARIEKGVLDPSWSQETYSKGATFEAGAPRINIPNLLADDGLTEVEIIGGHEAGSAAYIFPLDAQ